MYAYISASRGFGVAWYFISFMSLASVLIMNVCVGIVLDGVTRLLRAIRRRKLMKRQSLRLATMQRKNRSSAATSVVSAGQE